MMNFIFIIISPIQLSPTYCANCIDLPTSTPTPAGASVCPSLIDIPPLDTTPYFPLGCNLAAYVSHTLSFELINIELLTASYLDGLGVGTLPEVTTQEWLAARVHESSLAYQRL